MGLSAAGIALSFATLGAQAAVNINAKMYLEGALTGTALPQRTQLRASTAFPLTDPYGVGVTSASVPLTAVDWVKVELLAGPAAASCSPVLTTAGFLLADGSIVGADGGPLTIASAQPGSYNLRISHRNHAALISTPATFAAAASGLVDLTVAANIANPGNLATSTPVVAAHGGNADGNGVVSGTADPAAILAYLGGNSGLVVTNVYALADVTMDGTVRASGAVTVNDFNKAVLFAGGAAAEVPIPSTFPLSGAVCAAGAPVIVSPTPVPTLSPGMLGGLSAMLAFAAAGFGGLRRRKG